ncbi:DUF551 domain-containing protein [Pectobacterium odoriferum]|uniref:DUF551 domain-containing protein n=1 Tax=Pectobacterium odoriferum TaxID=78398 RepID=UPI0032F05314
MSWISVDDELPKVTRSFELFIINSDKGIGVAYYSPHDGFKNVHINGSVQHSHHDITHWMQLPHPPASK